MIRIEADATQSSHLEIMCAPVRLITNQSKIRVTLKRRVSAVVISVPVLVLEQAGVSGALTPWAVLAGGGEAHVVTAPYPIDEYLSAPRFVFLADWIDFLLIFKNHVYFYFMCIVFACM